MRTTALLLFAGLAHAGIELFEVDKDLWPDGVEVSLEKPAAEVHLVLAFKEGLGTLGEKGTAALASARFVVEYNDADRQTCYWNQYRPLPFDAEANPEWSGDDEAPGLFVTEGASPEIAVRTIVVRLPRVNRWRVRVTPLEGSEGAVERDAALIQVAEDRDAWPRRFEELDPLLPWQEAEVPAEEEPEEAEPPAEEIVEETYEGEAAAWTSVESVGRHAIRTMRAGKVPTGHAYRQANRAARHRACAKGATGDPVWQPLPALQPTPTPLTFPGPASGAPVAGTIPPWGAPLPFWAVPKPKAVRPYSNPQPRPLTRARGR